MPRILVIDGHPDPDSLTAALARAYVAGDARPRSRAACSISVRADGRPCRDYRVTSTWRRHRQRAPDDL